MADEETLNLLERLDNIDINAKETAKLEEADQQQQKADEKN